MTNALNGKEIGSLVCHGMVHSNLHRVLMTTLCTIRCFCFMG